MLAFVFFSLLPWLAPLVSGHSCIWHPSMWGFNVTEQTFSYDNRPVVPLMDMTYDEWWMHGHLAYPPQDGVFLELPAGGTLNSEIACDKGATSYYASSPGGNIQSGNNPCPGSPTTAFHANNEADTRGCALGITYQSNISQVKPEDFTIITTNSTCVWYRFTDFQIPADLPECPEDGCICSFNWIHAPDSGSEQIFMNGYRCKVTNSSSSKQLATPRLARRCGPSPDNSDVVPAPWNCTYGAKQAIYWLQKEGNTFFEGAHDPPYYNDFYGYPDGAQSDIFQDSEIPVFNDNGEQTGFTTLGGSTVTTANIVTPTISSGWPTTTSAAPAQATSSSSSSSGSGSNGSGSSSSALPSSTSSSSSAGGKVATSVAENVAENPSSSTSVSSSTPTSTPSSSTSTSTSPSASSSAVTTKCRNRSNISDGFNDMGKMKKMKRAKERAFRAHEKMSRRHDVLF